MKPFTPEAPEKLANPTYWAVVNADGTLARGSGATASAKVATDPGAHKITFGRNIAGCAYTATVGGSSTAPPPIGVASVYQNPRRGQQRRDRAHLHRPERRPGDRRRRHRLPPDHRLLTPHRCAAERKCVRS